MFRYLSVFAFYLLHLTYQVCARRHGGIFLGFSRICCCCGEAVFGALVQERLQMIEKAVAAAERDPARAYLWVNASIAREMLQHEDNLAMVLAPFLHGKR